MEDLKQQYFDEMKRLINSEYRDEIKIDEVKGNFNSMSIEVNKKKKLQQLEQVSNLSTYPSKCFNYFCYDDDDDDEDYTITVTPVLSTEEPDNSLSMGDEHRDTIPATESDEVIKSSVKNLNLTPNDYTSSDDESFSKEDVLVEHFKIYSNPLLKFDEEIFSSEINPLYNEVLEDLDPILPGNDNDHFNVESDLIESLLNKDTVITSPKIDFILEEFANEPALINPISPGIAETKFDPKVNICLIMKLLYDNSSPRPLEELNSENDFEKENSGNTTTHSDISLPDYEAFSFYDNHIEEISSGSTTTHSNIFLSEYDSFIFDLSNDQFPPTDMSDFYEFTDELIPFISLLEYDCFLFKVKPNSRDFTMNVVEDISPTKEPQVHNALPTHPNLQL
nr:hypothetical protein [Tanacetum cinerariifolium]GEX83608.1 hypothetical protein [Tanacetum cinerariifolium]